jgi:ADP-heptose:LPS heptosyltransferase
MLLPQRYYEHKKREILPEGALVVGFQPGAANIYKMWPVENFKKLAKMILAEYPNVIIAVTGSKKEHRLGEAIREADSERIINFCGKFGIENLPKLISEMDVLVTNDTGTMHVAIALGVPTVELFGATDSEGIGVYQDKDRHIVIQKTDTLNLSSLPKAKRGAELMHQISVREVAEASKKLLRNSF